MIVFRTPSDNGPQTNATQFQAIYNLPVTVRLISLDALAPRGRG